MLARTVVLGEVNTGDLCVSFSPYCRFCPCLFEILLWPEGRAVSSSLASGSLLVSICSGREKIHGYFELNTQNLHLALIHTAQLAS